MSANIITRLSRQNKTLEDYLNHNCDDVSEEFYNSPILNIVQENGIMGRKEQLKLKECYPGLQDAILEFLSKKNRGKLMIYKEGNKPPVINFFVYSSAGSITTDYYPIRSAFKSFSLMRRNRKIEGLSFVFLKETQNFGIIKHIKPRMGWTDELYELAI